MLCPSFAESSNSIGLIAYKRAGVVEVNGLASWKPKQSKLTSQNPTAIGSSFGAACWREYKPLIDECHDKFKWLVRASQQSILSTDSEMNAQQHVPFVFSNSNLPTDQSAFASLVTGILKDIFNRPS